MFFSNISNLLQLVNTKQTTIGNKKNNGFVFKNNLLIMAQKYKSNINQPINDYLKSLFTTDYTINHLSHDAISGFSFVKYLSKRYYP